jgi:hypothetical protein
MKNFSNKIIKKQQGRKIGKKKNKTVLAENMENILPQNELI